MSNPYIQLFILWLFYFIVHSLFASHWMKNIFRKYLPGLNPFYRFIYSLFSVVLLIPILLITQNISDYLMQPTGILKGAGVILLVLGLYVFWKGLRLYNVREFLGLNYRNVSPENRPDLQMDGLLKYSRHPLYASSIIMIIGYGLVNPTIGTWVSVSSLIAYFIIGIQFEERKLLKEYGHVYAEYRKEVPMLFPGIQRLLNLGK